MKKEEFKNLYNLFLERVIKFTPIAPFIENKLFETYNYLNEQELRIVFKKFNSEIICGNLKTGVEPSKKMWDHIVYSLYLDKTCKRGIRIKPTTESTKKEVGKVAGEFSKLLRQNNPLKIKEFIEQNNIN